MDKLLNVAQVANILNLSIHTIRLWTYQKKIPFFRLGSRILFRESDLEKWIEEHTHNLDLIK